MQTSLIIVDDFLENADELRAAALRMEYPAQEGYFAGRNSAKRLTITGLEDSLHELTGERLTPLIQGNSHGRFRLTLAGEVGKADIHIDPQVQWSGILYLNRPEDCQGGTDFFRHKATGSDQAPTTLEQLEAMGYTSAEAFWQNLVVADSNERDRWEHLMRVPMRYNRLVLLRPWLWHTASPGFGDSVENGRLVYLMFYVAEELADRYRAQGYL